MSQNHLCIHGHFYQPPREDPWMDLVQPEGTAAPSANWNERIVRESYAPLAWARRLDGQGRISELINCYEWINFNIGPTLLSWLERNEPRLYGRIIEADRRSVLRFGHGNAMAQAYHHAIMPLASARDREVETAWAISDFSHRFGREPEGMWLPETAVDAATLEVLADHGIRFTILAPGQVREVREDGGEWMPADRGGPDISRPWRIRLPSGRDMVAFLYNGSLSQAVAFEGLLADGEQFWRRLTGSHHGGLTSIGTDGETYGHHHRYGEMALAYVLEMARSGRDGFRLTNYASYLAAHPPTGEIRLHEPSSWSCAHGVERWRSDCGCTNGGHAHWHQRWRAPLRKALDTLKARLDDHFDRLGGQLFHDPDKALKMFGIVSSGLTDIRDFTDTYIKSQDSLENVVTAMRLLRMQQWALSMFASCAWFFDDMARVEPRNAMTYALRAMELAALTGAGDLETEFTQRLAEAEVNDERFATGADVWAAEVLPRRENGAGLGAQAVLTLMACDRLPEEGAVRSVQWPGAGVEVAGSGPGSGSLTVTWRPCGAVERFDWRLEGHVPGDLFSGSVVLVGEQGEPAEVVSASLFWKNREQVVLAWLDSEAQDRWERTLAAGRLALSRFLEYRAYQGTQVRGEDWSSRWVELAAAYVMDGFEGSGGARLVDFLRVRGGCHAAVPWLEERLGRELARMADQEDQPEKPAALLARAESIGLSPELVRAQNELWERAENGEAQALLPIFGFAVDPL